MNGTRVRVHAWAETPPDAIENQVVLEPQERPEPGPHDVVVEVRSAAVGWVDLLMTSGQYQHMANPPYTPGLEFAGVVAALGSQVSALKLGDPVLADGFQTGPRSHGEHRDGGFATWAVAPAKALMALPEGLSFDQGACLLGNYETAYHCLIARGRLQAGETVLIHGASGSTGLAAVHVAKAVGATVIATGRSPDKLAIVKAQGADHGVQSTGRFRDAVKAICPAGVDVVYDGVGGDISLESLRCVRFGARFLIVGWASTPFVAKGRGQRGAPNANVLPTNLLMMKGLDVLGCPTIISTTKDPSIRRTRLTWLMNRVMEGSIQPYIDASYPLSEVHEAMRAKWTSRHVGGCVVHPTTG